MFGEQARRLGGKREDNEDHVLEASIVYRADPRHGLLRCADNCPVRRKPPFEVADDSAWLGPRPPPLAREALMAATLEAMLIHHVSNEDAVGIFPTCDRGESGNVNFTSRDAKCNEA
jgi:hypothetical protein